MGVEVLHPSNMHSCTYRHLLQLSVLLDDMLLAHEPLGMLFGQHGRKGHHLG